MGISLRRVPSYSAVPLLCPQTLTIKQRTGTVDGLGRQMPSYGARPPLAGYSITNSNVLVPCSGHLANKTLFGERPPRHDMPFLEMAELLLKCLFLNRLFAGPGPAGPTPFFSLLTIYYLPLTHHLFHLSTTLFALRLAPCALRPALCAMRPQGVNTILPNCSPRSTMA